MVEEVKITYLTIYIYIYGEVGYIYRVTKEHLFEENDHKKKAYFNPSTVHALLLKTSIMNIAIYIDR
jgi:hypothetical protein